MARRKRGGEGLVSMASLVTSAMPRGAPPDLATWKLVSWWRTFAGKPLADHVWPSRIERGVLTLAADSSAWASEVTFMRERMIADLTKEMPALKVKSVRAIVGVARDLPVAREDSSDAEPGSRKVRMPSAKGLPRALAVALSKVPNEALRSTIARAARVSLAGRKDASDDAGSAADQGAGSIAEQGAGSSADQGAGADGSRSASSAQSSNRSPCPDGTSSDG